mmetsp:Transcript_22130/g.48934  ORF Transcript_22130/g.48934 Transcript_22130/m.48934 type:complete len:308 (-) Transcript_22130:114-1037(-)
MLVEGLAPGIPATSAETALHRRLFAPPFRPEVAPAASPLTRAKISWRGVPILATLLSASACRRITARLRRGCRKGASARRRVALRSDPDSKNGATSGATNAGEGQHSETELAWDFTRDFAAFKVNKLEEESKARPWWQWGSRGKTLGPPWSERLFTAFVYLLPLAGTMVVAAVLGVFEVPPGVRSFLPKAGVLIYLALTLGIPHGVVRRRATLSYFVRYNSFQALAISSVAMPAMLVQGLVPRALHWMAGRGPQAAADLADLSSVGARVVLGMVATAVAWATARVLSGNYPDQIPVVSDVADIQVRW